MPTLFYLKLLQSSRVTRVFDLPPRDRMLHVDILTCCAVHTAVAYGAFAGVSVDIICTRATVEAWPGGTFINVCNHRMNLYFKYIHNTVIYIDQRVICRVLL